MPHFGYLPPATPEQAASVYAHLHVTPQMLHYSHLQDTMALVGAVYGLVVVWLVLQIGLSARLRDWAQKRSKRSFLVAGTYWVLLSIVFVVLSLPIDIYSGFLLPHAYNLSHQGFLAW